MKGVNLKYLSNMTHLLLEGTSKYFFGTAEAYDIVHQEVLVKYEYQMLDILKCCLLHLDKNSLPLVVIHMFGQKDEDLGTISMNGQS